MVNRMADYIDRREAFEIASDLRDCISVEGYWAWAERIKRLPSEYAVEVVRCKDCRYWDKTKYSDYATMGECLIWRAARNRKDYCSEGRKKDGTDKSRRV